MRWDAALLVAGLLLVAILLAPAGPITEALWLALSLLAFAATVIGPRRHPPRRPHQGWLLSVALAGFVVVSLVSLLGHAWPDTHPVRLAALLLFPVSYVLIGLAMLRLVAARTPDGDPDGRIDGLLVLVATAVVLYELVTLPGAAEAGTWLEHAVLAAVPIVQAPVVAAAVRLLISGAARNPAAWLLLVAISSGLAGNVVAVLGGGDPWLSVVWALAYGALAVAALHPSFADLSAPATDERGSMTLGRLVVIGAALVVLPLVMLLEHGGAYETVVPTLGAAACVLLVLWRMARLLRQRDEQAADLRRHARREAVLATLGRRAVTDVDPVGFLAELEQAVGAAIAGRVTVVADARGRAAPTPTGGAPGSGNGAAPGSGHGAAPAVSRGPGGPAGTSSGAASAPLVLDLDAGGQLAVTVPSGRAVDAEEERFLHAVADLAVAALRRWRHEADLRHRSLHDPLTGLPNRELVLDRLRHTLAWAARAGSEVAVLFLDLDGFKAVNDARGHAAGDELLTIVADRLRRTVRAGDTVGRLSGDEFAVCVTAPQRTVATDLAERIRTALAEPYELAAGPARITASVGVAVAHGLDDAAQLLDRADAAMYAVKRDGKNRVHVVETASR